MKIKFERWHAFLIWLVGTLSAIAFIGDSMVLGLGIALASGAAFGLVTWLAACGISAKDAPNQNQPMLDPKRNFK